MISMMQIFKFLKTHKTEAACVVGLNSLILTKGGKAINFNLIQTILILSINETSLSCSED